MLITAISGRELSGETMTPMPPANNNTKPDTPARTLVFLLRATTASRSRRRSAALEGTGSTLPDSSELI